MRVGSYVIQIQINVNISALYYNKFEDHKVVNYDITL